MNKFIASLLIFVPMVLVPIKSFSNGETISPNMSLVVPAAGITTGPQWAADLDISLGIIDSHDHSPGKGVQVTPAGLNINSTLSMGNNTLSNDRSVQFTPQGSTPAVGSIYESGVDLFYVDGNGNNVRLTNSGSVAGSAGSISGLTSPASASYNSGTSTFVWQSNTNTSANLDASCLLQRDLTASSNAVTLCAPPSLAANYSLTWPAALPASQKFATIDNSGNIAANWSVDNSTIVVSGNSVQIPSNVPLPGKIPTSNGKFLVVNNTNNSAGNGLAIVRGVVNSDGSIFSGEGFTVPSSGTGSYTITYSSAFLDTPGVGIAVYGANNTITVQASSNANLVINTFNSSGSPSVEQFSFVVVGAKAN